LKPFLIVFVIIVDELIKKNETILMITKLLSMFFFI